MGPESSVEGSSLGILGSSANSRNSEAHGKVLVLIQTEPPSFLKVKNLHFFSLLPALPTIANSDLLTVIKGKRT